MFLAKLFSVTIATLALALPALATQTQVLACEASVYSKDDGTLVDAAAFTLDASGSSPVFHKTLDKLNNMTVKMVEVQVDIDGFDPVLAVTLDDQKKNKFFFHPRGNLGALFGSKKYFGLMNCTLKESNLVFKNTQNQILALDVYQGFSQPQLFVTNILNKNGLWCLRSDVNASALAIEKLLQFLVTPHLTSVTVDSDNSVRVNYQSRKCVERSDESDSPAMSLCSKTEVVSTAEVVIPVCK